MADVLERLTGSLSDRYRIERELGRGGMATVFLAEDLKHHRQVAIKVLQPELAAALGPERFLREIESTARLTHPHILPIHDSGSANGLLYYVMPYVRGESLRERLRREPQLPIDTALQIARDVADALGYAHRQGLVHRDVKPENILLVEGHAVLADFGIARAVESAGGEALTQTGFVVGTQQYMSPEQASGSGRLDGRSDLYSLGCVLYEMLAGQPPFTGPTAESLAHQHLSVEPRSVTALRPRAPQQIDHALIRALAKAPADRYATATEFAAALAAGAVAPERGAVRSRARLVGAAGAVAVATLVAVAAWQRWGPFESLLGGVGQGSPARKEWILVAEFEGLPGDPTLARAAREVLRAALDQSPTVATVPPDQIALALQQAGKPDTLPLTPTLAREIAYRSVVRHVLEGEITQLGKRFSILLRLSDIENDRQILTLTDSAPSEDALIPVLTRMAKRIEGKMRGGSGVLGTTRSQEWSVATPSFEAYRRWAEGIRLYYDLDYAGALRQARAALAIDPDFAAAWGVVASCQGNLGRPDSAVYAIKEVQKRPQRLTLASQLLAEGNLSFWQGDLRTALETFERVASLYPRSVEAGFALNHQAIILSAQGRVRQALDAERRLDEASPLAVSELSRSIRIGFLIALGRLPEARGEAQSVKGRWRQQVDLNLALAECDWGRADSLAAAQERDPQALTLQLVRASGARAAVAAVRGRVSDAEAYMRRAQQLERRPAMAAREGRGRVTLAIASGRPVPRPESRLERDPTTSALITRAYMAAAGGDTASARRLLVELRSRSSARLGAHGSTPEFIEASIVARSGRWREVVTLIAQAAREGSDRGGTFFDRIGIAPERLLVAQAYERLGRPDSAAAFYAGLLAPDNPSRSLDSYARLRLVVLCTQMGQIAEAERYLAVLERDLLHPDPDVLRMLEEARAAVASARAMSRPEKSRR